MANRLFLHKDQGDKNSEIQLVFGFCIWYEWKKKNAFSTNEIVLSPFDECHSQTRHAMNLARILVEKRTPEYWNYIREVFCFFFFYFLFFQRIRLEIIPTKRNK